MPDEKYQEPVPIPGSCDPESTLQRGLQARPEVSGAPLYSPRLVDHAVHPRNQGSLAVPDAVGTARSERCGDRMRLEFRLAEGRVQEVRCQAFGCGAAVAAGSAATELLEGRTVDAARRLTAFELDEAVGGVPAPKRHALLMVLQCLAEALGPRIPQNPIPGGIHA